VPRSGPDGEASATHVLVILRQALPDCKLWRYAKVNPADINETRLYLLRYDRGARAHSKLVRQLKTLSARITEGIPRWREAMRDHADTTGRWSIESTSLRLDFECYIEVLSRFFRLCRDVTGIEAIWE
jgi:hypothetical protein